MDRQADRHKHSMIKIQIDRKIAEQIDSKIDVQIIVRQIDR